VEHMVKDYIDIYYSKNQKPKTGYPKQLIDYIIKEYKISKEMKILDLGCGRGDFLEPFKNEGFSIYGLDLSHNSLKKLQNKGYNVKYCNFEENKIPFSKNYFDIVFSKSVIEHIANPENFLNEIKRILKTRGKLLIMTPDWYSQYKIFYNDFTHKRPYTIESLKNILINYGFKDVEVNYFYQLPYLWKIPYLKIFNCLIRWVWPKHIKSNFKLIRFSVELMLFAEAKK